MNVFLDLLKKNKILPNLDFSRDSIAKSIIGDPVVSPIPKTPIEQAMDVAKTLGGYSAAQVATDVPKGLVAALQLSPLAQLGHAYVTATSNTNPVENAQSQLGLAGDALRPIGYATNPLAVAGAGAGNVALQQAISMLQGKQAPNYGASFANGAAAAGPAVALSPIIQALLTKTPDNTKYVGDPTDPSNTQWIQKAGDSLKRDMRYGKRIQYVGK